MNRAFVPRAPRVRFVHPVWLQPVDTSEKSERLHSLNLSVGGMFVQSNMPREPGKQFELLLESKGKAFRLARAEVVWQGPSVQENIEGMGLRFIDIRPKAQELLSYLVGQSQLAEEKARAQQEVPTPATPPAEVVYFHPAPKNVEKPKEVYEASRTAMFELPRIQTSLDMPAAIQDSPTEEHVVLEDLFDESVLRPSRRWTWLLAFAVVGAAFVLLLSQAWSRPASAPAPAPVPTKVEAPAGETKALAKAFQEATRPEPEEEAPPEEEPTLDGSTSVGLSGAVSRVEVLTVENTVDVELFLTPTSKVSRWFLLKGPPRMVIDVTGVRPMFSEKETLAGGWVLRTGKTPSGTRLVFDLPQLPLESRREGSHFQLVFAP